MLLALAGCGRPASSGSSLDAPLSWQSDGDGHQLTVPSDALSVTLLGRGADGQLLALGVRDDAGRVLVDPADPEDSPNRWLPGHGWTVGALPVSSAALPLAARYAITAPAGTAVTAWVKRAPAMPAVQELPLAVLLVGGARSLGDSLDVALGQLGRIWRAAGIEILEPTRLSIDGPDRVDVDPALGSDSPSVGALLMQAPPGALTLVVVGDLAVGGEGLFAVAGSIPVPPQAGTPHSGVLASAALIAHDPLWAGQVIAHEVGHALGLFHTTEVSGLPDELDDTPACPLSAGRNGDGPLSAAECERYDAANLMFWATPRGATQLTAGQAEIARRSALVR